MGYEDTGHPAQPTDTAKHVWGQTPNVLCPKRALSDPYRPDHGHAGEDAERDVLCLPSDSA